MICTVVGARPNFVKMAPVIHEITRRGLPQLLVHTGQHYDEKMSTVFFDELGMPRPDVYLGVGSGSHAEQTAKVMMAFETILLEHHPVLVVVAGDVNSTLACALTASKLHIPVAHVESGLRSYDREMPEETNRVLTDHIADLLLVTEPSGRENLLKEGVEKTRIFFVGNTMIDSLRTHLVAALERRPWEAFDLTEEGYGVVTLHRPANVDDEAGLREIFSTLEEIAVRWPLLFPAHPRTVGRMAEWGLNPRGVRVVEPLGYLDFLGLMAKARVVLTDSGGIQEETTALGVPCITIRENTERPVTIEQGTNQLAGTKRDGILAAAARVEWNLLPRGNRIPELWDGQAARRVVDVLEQWCA